MEQVFRCYVEKRPGFDGEAQALLAELREQLALSSLEGLRLFNRYDAQGLSEETWRRAKSTVFSEPQVDAVWEALPADAGPHVLFAVEPLPGQFDQRSDSAGQCIQLMTGSHRPLVRAAKVYLLHGALSPADVERIKDYLINPVEAREGSLESAPTLRADYPSPPPVETVSGFTRLDRPGLAALLERLGLAMDLDDLAFLQAYFREEEKRDPTLTEIRVVDTYWSDHCRHTTFSTHLDSIGLDDPLVKAAYARYLAAREEVYGREKAAQRPQTLMDLATIGAKLLKKRGELPELDQSEEINACSIHVPAVVDGKEQDWLLMFKNETHNHPTEIEPFGGAATCIGGCIRDPLSGRAYVHQAMRITGGGDPRIPLSQTIPGRLPQRKLSVTAAAGYSSYGNQIGLATGCVHEVYHDGYRAKRLECGAVMAAAPAENVVRERPAPGDVIILLGGRTGRDGIGGATGSSKSHDSKSLTTMASEVQKGNPPEERKLQRLFRKGEVTRLIKRCNDFGAGGVSVAIGELADGLEIDLDAVRKKYDGLDGTELAISESQERMAVVVSPQNEARFLAEAEKENLEAYRVAVVTQAPRMVMRWRGQTVADLSRAFLDSNGAPKHAAVSVPEVCRDNLEAQPFSSLTGMASSLKCASRRGLVERFDSSIGAGSVLMPFGGETQRTPTQVMAALLPVLPGQETQQAAVMAWGFDPDQTSLDPFLGAYHAVTLSIAKAVAAGCDFRKVYLTLQEFFEKLRDDPIRWGKPFSALLGALSAQLDFGCAAIGGKDSMSGSFLHYDVPPTLISFAVAPVLAGAVLSPEFKAPGHPVCLFSPTLPPGQDGFAGQQRETWELFHSLCREGKVKAAWAVEHGLAEAVMKMSFGNSIGFSAREEEKNGFPDSFSALPGSIVAELEEIPQSPYVVSLGVTTPQPQIVLGGETVSLARLLELGDAVLEKVHPTQAGSREKVEALSYTAPSPAVCRYKTARPRAVIPVFPGTNCEYDTARACLRAGIRPETLVICNTTPAQLEESARALERAINASQMLILPGGFSGGDEPDGSAKLICSFFRSPRLTDAVHALLRQRDGLILGICNGFQALIKLGLVPYGEIRDPEADGPTLTRNLIGRHQSRYVLTRVASVRSPWMLKSRVGDLHAIPISHGEGRFVSSPALLSRLAAAGQIATQYVTPQGQPTMDIDFNPNGSALAIEGLFSPDGRVFGKMGHSERRGDFVAQNIPGDKHQPLFESGALYFR